MNPAHVSRGDLASWWAEVYFPTLAEQLNGALEQLHAANNWGLTIISAGLVFAVSTGPGEIESFMALLLLVVLTVHFTLRAMRGYINVIRWSCLQARLMGDLAQSPPVISGDTIARIKEYHVDWRLPIRRRDAWMKVLLELGFGYLLVTATVTAVFSLTTTFEPLRAVIAALAGGAIALELTIFTRGPYMRRALELDPIARARR